MNRRRFLQMSSGAAASLASPDTLGATPAPSPTIVLTMAGEMGFSDFGCSWEHEGNRTLRDGNWKFVSRRPDRRELYEMEAGRCGVKPWGEAEALGKAVREGVNP